MFNNNRMINYNLEELKYCGSLQQKMLLFSSQTIGAQCVFFLVMLVYDFLHHLFIIMFSAVIGAGLGGTSAAFYLRQLFGDQIQIDIFEANKVGGRTALVDIGGKEYEAGGSILHKKNKYMVDFASRFNKSE